MAVVFKHILFDQKKEPKDAQTVDQEYRSAFLHEKRFTDIYEVATAKFPFTCSKTPEYFHAYVIHNGMYLNVERNRRKLCKLELDIHVGTTLVFLWCPVKELGQGCIVGWGQTQPYRYKYEQYVATFCKNSNMTEGRDNTTCWVWHRYTTEDAWTKEEIGFGDWSSATPLDKLRCILTGFSDVYTRMLTVDGQILKGNDSLTTYDIFHGTSLPLDIRVVLQKAVSKHDSCCMAHEDEAPEKYWLPPLEETKSNSMVDTDAFVVTFARFMNMLLQKKTPDAHVSVLGGFLGITSPVSIDTLAAKTVDCIFTLCKTDVGSTRLLLAHEFMKDHLRVREEEVAKLSIDDIRILKRNRGRHDYFQSDNKK